MTVIDWIVLGVLLLLVWAAASHQYQINWNQRFLVDEMDRLHARADGLQERIDELQGEVDNLDRRI